MDDGKTLASAEIAYQTMRATVAATAAKSIIGYGAIAAVLGLFAMVALTVGLLLALTPLVTAWGATAIVVGGYALIAFLCVKRASRRWQDAKATLAGTETVQ
ncbi:MAG: phage holin family protein [Pseudomonadota bacterium]